MAQDWYCGNCSKRFTVQEPPPQACPFCKGSKELLKLQSNNSAQDDSSLKKCSFCGEDILLVAIKCKHCGSMLDGSAQSRNVTITGLDPFAGYRTPIKGKLPGNITGVGIAGIVLGSLGILASIAGCLTLKDASQGAEIIWVFIASLGFIVSSYLWARK